MVGFTFHIISFLFIFIIFHVDTKSITPQIQQVGFPISWLGRSLSSIVETIISNNDQPNGRFYEGQGKIPFAENNQTTLTTISPPTTVPNITDSNETDESDDSETQKLESQLLDSLQLHITRGQYMTLIRPSSQEFQSSTQRNCYIKLSIEIKNVGNSENNNNTAKYMESVIDNGMTDRASYRYQLAQGKVIQQLASNSCIAIAFRRPSIGTDLHNMDIPHLPFSCANAFANKFAAKRLDPLESVRQSPRRSTLSSVVCGGIYVPRGGHPGDLVSDPLLSFPSYTNSIVFSIPIEILIAAESAYYNYADFNIDKLKHLNNKNITLQNILQHNLRICFYPKLHPDPAVLPLDIGALHFIDSPNLAPIYKRDLRTPVRIFLNPGWSFNVPINGFNFTQSKNLLSLKLEDCSGFFDSMSFRSTHAERITEAEQQRLPSTLALQFLNDPLHLWSDPDEALFSFHVDFKVEESE